MNIKEIGIIGYGDFGKFISEVFRTNYPDVKIKISSRSNTPNNREFYTLDEVCKTDILFPCVPISKFEETIENIKDKVSKDTVLFEVCTVKSHPAEILKKYSNQFNYLCTHPMFGPYSYKKLGNKLNGLRMVISDNNLNTEKLDYIKNYLENLNLDLVYLDAEEHDKKLAKTLFLTHLISQGIINADFRRTDIDTVSFGFLMDAVESVANDTELFQDVFRYNPFCREVINDYKNSLTEVEERLIKM